MISWLIFLYVMSVVGAWIGGRYLSKDDRSDKMLTVEVAMILTFCPFINTLFIFGCLVVWVSERWNTADFYMLDK